MSIIYYELFSQNVYCMHLIVVVINNTIKLNKKFSFLLYMLTETPINCYKAINCRNYNYQWCLAQRGTHFPSQTFLLVAASLGQGCCFLFILQQKPQWIEHSFAPVSHHLLYCATTDNVLHCTDSGFIGATQFLSKIQLTLVVWTPFAHLQSFAWLLYKALNVNVSALATLSGRSLPLLARG